ncbi:MAG: metallophosphoesterase [Desulfosalsimonas sp.]|uniref:metallophosphoesterase n=1 Tax=Desulfosalsimonas sp. TaxID=3073848 RepID=UPI0039704A7F
MKFALFALTMTGIMLMMHYAVFRSAISFFQISRPGVRYLLYAAMVLLSFSFISAFVAIHWRQNPWTIAYYRFAAVWTGFLIHSLSAAAAAWILLGAGRLAGVNLPVKGIGTVMLALAVMVSGYGIWAAFHPVVRYVSVPVADLPEAWKNSKIAVLSDMHLGLMHQQGFARHTVKIVNSLQPDLVLITGDLIDGMGGPYTDNLKPLNDLEARHGLFFVTGNHEHYVGIEKSLRLIQNTPLRILDNEAVAISGLELVGVSYPGIAAVAGLGNFSQEKTPGIVRVVMFHTPTEMGIHEDSLRDRHLANYWLPDTRFITNRKLNADLQISGHTHGGQIFPLQFLTRWLYGGHDYGLKKINGLYLYTTSGTGSWGPPMRTAGRPEIVVIRLVKKRGK